MLLMRAIKDEVIALLNRLPDDASLEDIQTTST